MARGSDGGRLEAVQVMRAIAAMLVVVDHAINSNDFRTDLPRSWLGAGNFNEFGASGVDLFFVLSGFVMAHVISSPSASSAPRFMINRLIRIVPYYWLASLVFLAVTTATGRSYGAAALLNNLTIFPIYDADTFVPPALIVGWTLSFELAFYTIVSFSIAMSAVGQARVRITAQAVGLLAVTGLIIQPRLDLLAIWVNPMWVEFILGLLVHRLWSARGNPPATAVSAFLLLGGIGGLGLSIIAGIPFDAAHWAILNEDAGILRPVWWALPYALAFLGLLWLTDRSPRFTGSKVWRFLLLVGDASYSLYLVHLAVIFTWEDLAPTNRINADFIILCLVAASVAVALVAYRYVEQPMLGWLRRQFLSRPVDATSRALV